MNPDVVLDDLNFILSKAEHEFSEMSGKSLLITGGAGFLGYYLIKSVLHWNDINEVKSPIRLHVYDNFIRGMPNWFESFKTRNDIDIKKHDISIPLPHNVTNFSYIIHAASIASPIFYRLHPIETMDANVQGLRFLLDYTLRQKRTKTPVEGFLFFSSSEIYGNPSNENIPTPEFYNGNVSCTGPRACYDESKRYGETLSVNFATQYELPIKIARPFNNYGPGLRISDRRAIPDFARDIFNNENIVLLSNGTPMRTFCYVSDAIVGYYKTLINGKAGESYNIGVETPEISIYELAKRMTHIGKEHFNYTGKIEFKTSSDTQYLTDNPLRRCPDISKARNEIGYNPSIEINDGLLRAMHWYSENLSEE